jgi:hypothetical protein
VTSSSFDEAGLGCCVDSGGGGRHKFPSFMVATDFTLKLETDAIVLVFPFFTIMFALELTMTTTSIPASYFGKL